MESAGAGGKRKIDDQIALAKQKAEAIAARFMNDAESKRPRTSGFSDSAPPPLNNAPSPQPQQQQPSSYPVSYAPQTNQYSSVPSSKRIHIPNGKVGVIIGRGGDMIKNLQQRSGAKIQITRDADAEPGSTMRDVELMGTQEQISRAEELINEVIAETDQASTGSTGGGRGVAPPPPGSNQIEMKVPNDKVALVIGKGGETIKSMQAKSGARIQVVPLHPPPGDPSRERSVFINGTPEQIEAAKELVNEVISGNRLKGMSGGNTYGQPTYPGAAAWGNQGQPPAQQPSAYGYTQPGGYGVQQPPYYGGYPSQTAAWDQQTNSSAAPAQQQNSGYNAYGQQAQPTSAPANANYNYGQVPPSGGYNYSAGYPQQPPSYGQDMSGQAPATDPAKSYTNPAYGPPATSAQPDGSAAAQTSQPGYGAPAVTGQPDGTAQSQAPSAYATGYSQPAAAPANGYGAYPGYSAAPPAQPAYSQTGYGYGQQQDGQAANQAAYYYGQGGYPAQSGYYQGGYPPAAPTQVPPQTQSANGVSQSAGYGTDGGEAGAASAVTAEESERSQS